MCVAHIVYMHIYNMYTYKTFNHSVEQIENRAIPKCNSDDF